MLTKSRSDERLCKFKDMLDSMAGSFDAAVLSMQNAVFVLIYLELKQIDDVVSKECLIYNRTILPIGQRREKLLLYFHIPSIKIHFPTNLKSPS